MRASRPSDTDVVIAQNTHAFALSRLNDREFLEWALKLGSDQIAERTALRRLLELQNSDLREPYRHAWTYLLEYWNEPAYDNGYNRLLLKRELNSGASSSEVIKLITEAVRPRIKVESGIKYEAFGNTRAKHPKTVRDIFWISMTGGERVTPEEIGLSEINDRDCLFELAAALNKALLTGLNQAKRIGMIANEADSTAWLVHRVYFVPAAEFVEGGGEPDRYARGFAPTIKLLHAVFQRLSEIDGSAALRVMAAWDIDRWKLYKRLWAAAARDETLVNSEDVGRFLISLNDTEFWLSHTFPEIAELRAVRWSSLQQDLIAPIEQRLIAGEPIARLSKRLGRDDAKLAVKRRSVTELQRIKAGGGQLSRSTEEWLKQALIQQPRESEVVSVTEGFNPGVRTLHDDRSGDPAFADVPSAKLIDELARHLSDDGWESKSRAASDFIGRNPDLVLDLLTVGSGSSARLKVWEAFGYSFRPSDLNATIDRAGPSDKTLILTALKACLAIAHLDESTIKHALRGLTSWMSSWDMLLRGEDDYLRAWLTLWPAAVAKTNHEAEHNLPLRDRSYSSPVGNLISAFMRACPSSTNRAKPLAETPWSDALVAIERATSEAKLQAQYQLLSNFNYFWAANKAWSRENLLEPLVLAAGPSIELWHGFSLTNQLPPKAVLEELSTSMIAAAAGKDLPDETRGSLSQRVVFSMIIDMRNGEKLAIPAQLTQQMLRIGGDPVRARALDTMKKYLRDTEAEPKDPAKRFGLVKKLFQDIWPKELTLSSPRLSDSFADFPAAADNHYAAAAELILPYLTPFDCWSLWDYGVFNRNAEEKTIDGINLPEDAEAFLSVLDKTVGAEDGAIIPNGLDKALKHIKDKNRKLEADVRYQRLLTLSRH
ncbi:hypothetical protein [Rhizobium halophytocola]|uniref:Uncharacterized protein n=1 Tax=Rhizobium halophytocola TaxID=735519 RepID=A0ABS4E448_9HYPH|nr:hypothetical protein [Rhizobium halophytocola]MBP1852725.1 hypothetical protein [Rhizobium halophytocola]